jgi:DTW domain-containing protein YfiP
VLYLGSARPAAVGLEREIVVLDRAGVPTADQDAMLRGLEGVVLLDGSWSEAKTLWWRNPWLLRLHRIVLDPPLPARLGRLRREPRREALSTIEAAALTLRHLEPGQQAADALIAALDGMIAAARRPARLSR